MADKIAWKRQRAITKHFINESKKSEFRNYLDEMRNDTPMSQIYDKLRKIRGYPLVKYLFSKMEMTK